MGLIRGWLRRDGETTFVVGAKDESPDPSNEWPYTGPTAEIYVDNGFVHICTDAYEGNAMLNIESLPFLINALSEIYRKVGIARSPAEAAARAAVKS